MSRQTLAAAPRFAIYFVPGAATVLYRFGAAMLGYDCYTGERVAHLPGPPDDTDWSALTAEPRTYGFHATLKAPFRLREECADTDLPAQLEAVAASAPEIPTFAPTVALIGGFVAIIPQSPSPALDQLAAECVTRFDSFRAPMTADERGRRTATNLSDTQMRNLERWGYPYVFDEFRFHMTLTGHLPPDRRLATQAYLRKAFAEACGSTPIRLNQIALLRQEPGAPLRLVGQARLRGDHTG